MSPVLIAKLTVYLQVLRRYHLQIARTFRIAEAREADILVAIAVMLRKHLIPTLLR